jgi:hypothetical protein
MQSKAPPREADQLRFSLPYPKGRDLVQRQQERRKETSICLRKRTKP